MEALEATCEFGILTTFSDLSGKPVRNLVQVFINS